ncbi:hypothetical protein FNV43_RR20777 [Rhamnella rubrinervis]|uniref:TF-B3 domain-containing protein n=1 Tax=Rhamnella rubrinervis TaxID=2594499 RepID=A0A8K0DWK6_9ROSA|nr:hypothetical protein FNV43_RR20777 [Rhamnella rubrinervis]
MEASFEKLLTETDVNKKLSVPSAFLRHINGGQGGKAVEIVDDITGKTYQLMLQTRAGKYRKPVFQSKGWLKFVKDKGLQAGDTIYFWKDTMVGNDGVFRTRALFDFWSR